MSRIPIPTIRARVAQRLGRSTGASPGPGLQGSNFPGSAGGTVANGSTYSEVVACAGANAVRVRLLTATATGTLNLVPVAPMAATSTDESARQATGFIDPAKVTAYATGGATVAVVAGTEVKLDLTMFGESYVLVQFVCSANGTIVFCDISQLQYT